MKIILTGAKGNLGQKLQSLGQEHQWLPIDRGDWGKLSSSVASADVMIHAASDLTTPMCQDPLSVVDSNITSTARVVEALRTNPRCRLIFISSCAVYGRSQETSEEQPLAPISANGMAKLYCEQMLKECCACHGVPLQIVRLFNTFGGDDRFSIIAQLERSLRESKPFVMFNEGRSQRDFVHVEDVAKILLALLKKPIHYPLLNLGSGETTRIRDVVNVFRERYPKLQVVNKTRQETEYSRADITRLREMLPNYTFRRVLDSLKLGAGLGSDLTSTTHGL